MLDYEIGSRKSAFGVELAPTRLDATFVNPKKFHRKPHMGVSFFELAKILFGAQRNRQPIKGKADSDFGGLRQKNRKKPTSPELSRPPSVRARRAAVPAARMQVRG